MRSSFIKWLVEQNHRIDNIGKISRWVNAEIETGFEPIELHCVLSRILEKKEKKNLIKETQEAFLEFASELFGDVKDIEEMLISGVKIIPEDDVMDAKLDNAVRSENYEEAARLRDQINEKKKK